MSGFWKTLLLSAAFAGVVAAGYAWLRYDEQLTSSLKASIPSLLNMDLENLSEEQLNDLMDELASQI